MSCKATDAWCCSLSPLHANRIQAKDSNVVGLQQAAYMFYLKIAHNRQVGNIMTHDHQTCNLTAAARPAAPMPLCTPSSRLHADLQGCACWYCVQSMDAHSN